MALRISLSPIGRQGHGQLQAHRFTHRMNALRIHHFQLLGQVNL